VLEVEGDEVEASAVLGLAVGLVDGLADGDVVGDAEGEALGDVEGEALGLADGEVLGLGLMLGLVEGCCGGRTSKRKLGISRPLLPASETETVENNV
jgi:hypothetical protein